MSVRAWISDNIVTKYTLFYNSLFVLEVSSFFFVLYRNSLVFIEDQSSSYILVSGSLRHTAIR